MIGTTSPIPASLPRSGGLEAVLDPVLQCLHMEVQKAHVGLGRDEQGGGGALLGPLVTAGVEAVVDPGQGPRVGVFLESLELPVGGSKASAAVECQIRKLRHTEDPGQMVVGAVLPSAGPDQLVGRGQLLQSRAGVERDAVEHPVDQVELAGGVGSLAAGLDR